MPKAMRRSEMMSNEQIPKNQMSEVVTSAQTHALLNDQYIKAQAAILRKSDSKLWEESSATAIKESFDVLSCGTSTSQLLKTLAEAIKQKCWTAAQYIHLILE